MNKIVFNEIEIPVVSCYSFLHDSGKEILTLTSNATSFDVLKGLDGYSGPIQYFENDELKTEYTNYSMNFTCNYKDGVSLVQLTRKSATELDLINTMNIVDTLLTVFIPMMLG